MSDLLLSDDPLLSTDPFLVDALADAVEDEADDWGADLADTSDGGDW